MYFRHHDRSHSLAPLVDVDTFVICNLGTDKTVSAAPLALLGHVALILGALLQHVLTLLVLCRASVHDAAFEQDDRVRALQLCSHVWSNSSCSFLYGFPLRASHVLMSFVSASASRLDTLTLPWTANWWELSFCRVLHRLCSVAVACSCFQRCDHHRRVWRVWERVGARTALLV